MLVLTRKNGQRIRIGHSVSITVLEIQGGKVKLGLSGPPDVTFHREELYQRIQADGVQLRQRRPALEAVCD